MEEKFLLFVAEVMDVDRSEISFETEYKKYEKWDSLMMMTLIMEIEAEYNTSIPIESVGKVKTLQDMYDFIQ